MNISVKELKEKEGSKVEEISWNILNRMREDVYKRQDSMGELIFSASSLLHPRCKN